MTCEECEQILLDSGPVSRKGWMLDTSVSNLAKSHAQNCMSCAVKMSEIANMKVALEQLRDSMAQMEAPTAVEMKVLAAFRREKPEPAASLASVFPWRAVWGSVAALLLAAAGVVLSSSLRPRSPKTVQTERNHGDRLRQRQLSPTLSGATGRSVIEHPRPGTKHDVAASSSGDPGKLDKSIQGRRRSPMPAGDELSLNGGSNVVRVTLPLSTLVAMGIPMHPDVSDRRVTADVMRDPFGAVVAIHLVEVKPDVELKE